MKVHTLTHTHTPFLPGSLEPNNMNVLPVMVIDVVSSDLNTQLNSNKNGSLKPFATNF
jgi:hypothetical protein